MQVDIRGAIDGVILAPAVRRPIGAASKQAMQNGEKHRAFEREAVLREPARSSITWRQPVSSHNRSKTSAAVPRRARRDGALGDGVDDDGFRSEARA